MSNEFEALQQQRGSLVNQLGNLFLEEEQEQEEEESLVKLPCLILNYHRETSPHYFLSFEKRWASFHNTNTFAFVKNFLRAHETKNAVQVNSTDYLFQYESQIYILPCNLGETLENFLNREIHTVTIFPPYDSTLKNVVHPTVYSMEPKNTGDPFQHLNTFPPNFR
jgi:hypothetical protein